MRERGLHPIIATMTDESILRYNQWIRHGCNAFNTSRPISKPISVWNEQNILQYIVDNNVKIAEVYGEIKKDENGRLYTTGASRTGCMFCMYGIQKECRPNRFDKMRITHPKQYEYCMNTLGIRKVLDYIGIGEYKDEDW